MTKIPMLFEILKERGISPAKLSADTGISAGNISDWKSGRSKPSAERLAILSQYLNVTVDYLLGGKAEVDKQLNGVDFALLSETENLTIEQKEDVLKYIRFIKADSNKE